MVLDLHFASAAEETLVNTRGGPMSRVKGEAPYDSTFRSHRAYNLLFGLKEGHDLSIVPHDMLSSSNYVPAPAIADIARDSTTRRSYVFAKRAPGPGVMSDGTLKDDQGHVLPPRWFAFDSTKSVLRYGFVGGNFVLGSSGRDPTWWDGWNAFEHSGPREVGGGHLWQGVTFKITDGKPGSEDARIGFDVEPSCKPEAWHAVEPYTTLQYKNIMVTRRWVPTGSKKNDGPNKRQCNPSFLKIYFSQTLDEVVDRKDGWVFAKTAGAFAALRIVAGGHKWVDSQGAEAPWTHAGLKGNRVNLKDLRFLLMAENAPAILVVNDAVDYGNDFSRFQEAVRGMPISYDAASGAVQVGSIMTFYGPSRLGKIDGESLNLAPRLVNHSPFIRGEWDSGLICIRKGQAAAVLDVRDPNNPSKQTLNGPPYPDSCPAGTGEDKPVVF
jgi:hypothetical protein